MHFGSKNPWVIAWGAGSFFLVMALVVPAATKRGWGMQGIFFAMVVALATAYLLPVVCKHIYRRLTAGCMSLGEFGKFMAGGYSAPVLVETSSYALLDTSETQEDQRDQADEGCDTDDEWFFDEETQGRSLEDEEDLDDPCPPDCLHLALHPH
jgi:hypothetical protein